MVHESYYWKRELLKISRKMSKRVRTAGWASETEESAFELEIMLGFYMIRKLINAKTKLSNSLVSTKIPGRKYANNGTKVHLMNDYKFHEFYNFDRPVIAKFDLIFLCNQLIHSYIFSACFDFTDMSDYANRKLAGIQFSSDDQRNKWLFEIDIQSVINVFKNIGNDYPSSSHHFYDGKSGDWKIVNSNEKHPIPKEVEGMLKVK